MKYKNFILILILVCFLFSISSVYANEVNNNITQQNPLLKVSNEENIALNSNYGTFSELNNEIQNAENEIKLTKNYIYTDEDSEFIKGIIINKPLTIDGNDFTINGNKKSIAFTISSTTIILKNIHFENCREHAISFNKVTNGEIINSTFTKNTAWNENSAYGGCISIRSSNIKITNTNFIGNRVDSNYESGGGCIYASSSDLNIQNSSFIENRGGSDTRSNGGCIYAISSNLIISNTIFLRNDIGGSGGGIYVKGSKLYINSSNFTKNYAKSGGSIYSSKSNLKIENSSFDEDYARDQGGSIRVYDSMLLLNSSNFTNSEARYLGAALYCTASIGKLENCEFKNSRLSETIQYPLEEQYIQESCLINCSFYKSSINTAIGGGLRDITKLEVIITNNTVDITVINPNFYNGTVFDGQGYYLSIEEYPFPSSHNSWQMKNSLILRDNHARTTIDNIQIGLNQYRVYYSNFINNFYYYFNITKTVQSSISVNPIIGQRGTNVILKLKIDDNLNIYAPVIGSVKLTIDGKTYSIPVKRGESQISISMPKKAGTFTYKVNFIPNSEYSYASSTNLKVVSKYGTKITIKSVTGYQGKKVKLIATVKDDAGNKIKKGKVTFKINGKTYTANVKNGLAIVTINYPKAKWYKDISKTKGNYRYKTSYYKSIYASSITFKGYGTYLSSSAKFKVTSNGKPITHKYRIYNYRTFTLPVKNTLKFYNKGSVVLAVGMKHLTNKNILIVGVGDNNDHPINFKVKTHFKKNGKWRWGSWFSCDKNHYFECNYGTAITIDKVQIICYSPYFVKIY